MYTPLTSARLEYSEAGVPYSSRYRDTCHSAEDAINQARHVYIAGNRLAESWAGKDNFAILETGFGPGLNFLATWQAWKDDPTACRHLHYVAAELHPFNADDLARLHAAWPELAVESAALRAAWPTLTPGFHRLELADGQVILTLLLGDADTLLAKLRAGIDAFYLDGFNPALWSETVLRQLGRLANRGASLATWPVAQPMRELLYKAGFKTDTSPGYGRKQEILIGRFVLADKPCPLSPDRRAIVLGAGVAGCTGSERLARRGWQITLIDRRNGPAEEASGNLAGILMPLIARDDNIAARLSRACYLYGLRHWRHSPGARMDTCGVIQFARTPEQDAHMRATVTALALPDTFIRYLDMAEASAWLGQPAPAGAWLFPQGGWANPPSLCRSALTRAGSRLQTLFARQAARIERQDGEWRVFDPEGHCLATAPHLILANGVDAGAFAAGQPLPIQRVRGQVTLIPEQRMPPLKAALCRDGYATPAVDGRHAVGASYSLDADPEARQQDDIENLERLRGLLPEWKIALDAGFASRVGFRPVLPDRLPITGALPDWDHMPTTTAARLSDIPRQDGLHGLLGYASRGLVWAGLLADTLASQLEGEPLPIEADLQDAVDPGRFALRKLRKGG